MQSLALGETKKRDIKGKHMSTHKIGVYGVCLSGKQLHRDSRRHLKEQEHHIFQDGGNTINADKPL